jgi:hypothetical protein
MLVSGRVRAGQVELDPTYALETVATPSVEGEYAVELLDADGAVLDSRVFSPTSVAREEGGETEAHFAVAVPLAEDARAAVGSVAIRRAGLEVARRVAADPPTAADAAGDVELLAGPGPASAPAAVGPRLHLEVFPFAPFTRGAAAGAGVFATYGRALSLTTRVDGGDARPSELARMASGRAGEAGPGRRWGSSWCRRCRTRSSGPPCGRPCPGSPTRGSRA